MTSAAAAEAELKVVLAQIIGALRTLSEAALPLQHGPTLKILSEASMGIEKAFSLADRLP